jgi:penicillin-binding protein 1A
MDRFQRLKDSFKNLQDKKAATAKKAGSKGSIRVNQNLSTKVRARKDLRDRKRAEYLATLPKSRIKRFFYRLHPKRLARYWFSREGAFMALKINGIGLLVGAALVAVVFAYFRKDLPKNITDLQACSLGQTIKYYDRTGETLLWAGAGDVDCRPVPLDDISPFLRNAVIAAEDKKFYEHPGFDPAGLMNAVLSNVKSGGGGRGGSTITQQYVKLALLSSERSVTRKIKELILAVELDASYDKNQILQAYLNEIGIAYQYNGAEAAARGLFDKSAKDLTLDEAATMAAGIPAPDYYWVQDQSALIARRDYVLDQMVITGTIKKEEAEAAKQVDTLAKVTKTASQYKDIKAPHFVLAVRDQLKERYGKDFNRLGLTVITSVDMNLQKMAEESVANGIANMDKNMTLFNQRTGQREAAFNNAALVVEDVSNGQVVAMVGSRDFNAPGYGQINIATTPRSPGSSFKPYDYAALMKYNESFGAGSIMYDLDTDFGGGYKPGDYDSRQPGGISMRYALGGSRNTPAIKAMYIAGIDNTHQLVKDLGIKSGITGCAGVPDCSGILSTAIGDGGQVRLDEHVNAYGTFSRLGETKEQTYILKINDAKGKTIYEWKDQPGTQAIDPQIAYIVSSMLSDRNASYFRIDKGYSNSITRGFEGMNIPAAMKTGTTNNWDNGWLLGYTGKYSAGVWIGHSENKSSCPDRLQAGAYKNSQGRSGCQIGYENFTSPIWGEFMKRAHEALAEKPGDWKKPEGVKTVSHDSAFFATIKAGCTPAQLGNVCGFSQSDIYPSWYKAPASASGKKATIDIVSGKLATDCTPDGAKKEIVSGNIQPEIPTSDPNYQNWLKPISARYNSAGGAIPTEKDDVHKCDDIKPTVTLSAVGSKVTATYSQGTHPLKTLNFRIGDQIVQSFDVSSNGSTSYTVSGTGDQQVTAQIVDAVLYDATSNPVTVAGTAPLTLTQSSTNATRIFFSWTGGTGDVDVIRKSNSSVLCGDDDGTCDAAKAGLNGVIIYAQDENGVKSPEITISF